MTDPWAILTPMLQGGAILTGIAVLFKVIVTDPIARANKDADFWKGEYKSVVHSRRAVLRGDIPESFPPDPAEDTDDNTQRTRAVDRYDAQLIETERQRRMLEDRSRGQPKTTPLDAFGPRLHPETSRELRRYARPDLATTPPAPSPSPSPILRPYRNKLPSRKG